MKILVIKPSSLGDVIHALPFLKALKDTFPKSQVDWVISKQLKGIIENNPLINRTIVFDKDSWKKVRNLPDTLSEISSLKRKLNAKQYDMVVDLQGLLRSGLIARSTSARSRIGFKDAREGSRFLYDKKVTVNGSLHAVDKCLEVAKAIGAKVHKVKFPLTVDKTAKANVKKLLGNIKEYIVVVPSARWISKRWPAEKFASLINKLSVPCVISGSRGDRKIAQSIIDLISDKNQIPPIKKEGEGGFFDNTINLCGKTDLRELVALMAGAKAVVSNDSGPMHIAAALNVPVIGIFGPTDPAKTGPYGWQKNKKLMVMKAGVSCSPCRKKKCPDLICMNNISASKVLNALKEYL
jgi:lipopolysaccharide heptosyltransferase I